MATEIFLLYDRQKRGLHQMADHQRLDQDLEALIERYPDYATPYNTLALLWWGLAEFRQRAGEDPQPALARAENALRRLLEIDPDHESGLINLAGILRHRYRFGANAGSEDLEWAADEALSIYRRLERQDAERQEFGCLVAEVLTARANRQPPALGLELLAEAERLSQVESNIDWLRLECLATRARIAIAMYPFEGAESTVSSIWKEFSTLMAQDLPEDANLLHTAARLAWSLNRRDLAADWSAHAAARNPQFAVLPPSGRDSAMPTP